MSIFPYLHLEKPKMKYDKRFQFFQDSPELYTNALNCRPKNLYKLQNFRKRDKRKCF